MNSKVWANKPFLSSNVLVTFLQGTPRFADSGQMGTYIAPGTRQLNSSLTVGSVPERRLQKLETLGLGERPKHRATNIIKPMATFTIRLQY